MKCRTAPFGPFPRVYRAAILYGMVSVLFLICFMPTARAAQVTLEWDPNPESNVAGYKLYYGFETGNYEHTVDVGNQTTYTVTGLEENQPVYFVVTCYNTSGTESGYSNQVVFEAENLAPTAAAGPDQTVDERETVTLSGTNSSDPEGRALSYVWEQTSGPVVDISNATTSQAGFTAPDVGMDGESLIFRLTVTDDIGLQAEDFCIVTVSWVNQPPTADAGADQNAAEGDEVVLDGVNSSDPDDGISAVLWQQISGPAVEILDPTQAVTAFTAPQLTSESVSLTFELAVQDAGGLIDTDTCVINISWINTSPTADAGPDQTVDAGASVTLDGSGSSDPDDGIGEVRWTQTAGTPVTLSDPSAFTPTFTAPAVEAGETLSFELTVTDNGGLVAQDTCLITVNPVPLNVSPAIHITANNEEGTVENFRRRPVKITVSIAPNDYQGETVDTWLIVDTSNGRFFYARDLGWFQTPIPYTQTPLDAGLGGDVFKDKLPVDQYTFRFGVDNNADGNFDGTWVESVLVKVW